MDGEFIVPAVHQCQTFHIYLPFFEDLGQSLIPFLQRQSVILCFADPLFLGDSCRISVAEAMSCIEQLARDSNWSQRSKSQLYELLHTKLLPVGNNCPADAHEATKLLSPFGVSYSISACCINDCIVYSGSNSVLSQCPSCESPAAVDGLPAKQFRHVSIILVLRRLYHTKASAEMMRAPQPNLDVLTDIWGKLSSQTNHFPGIVKLQRVMWFACAIRHHPARKFHLKK